MSRPLRVLFLATYFPKPGNPLIGTWALEQARALSRRPDLCVRVISPNAYLPRAAAALGAGARAYAQCPPFYNWGDVRVQYPRWLNYPTRNALVYAHPEPFLRLGWISARRALERAVRGHKPDVVFAHHTGASGYLAAQLKRRLGVPYVVTDHLFSEITDCEDLPARRHTFARILGGAAASVAVAKRMENDVRRLFPQARAITIHNGSQAPTQAQWQKRRPPEIEGVTVILGAGIFYSNKGFPALVRAWGAIEARFPDAVLRLVGEGADRANIEAEIAKLPAHRVQMVGALGHAELMQEMVWADIFALISRDDPFPTVLLEALAAAKPLVWPDDSGINDVLVDGRHGFKVPPHDEGATARALAALLEDPERRDEMARASKALSQQSLTWDANAAAMSALFREVAGKG